MSKILDKVDEIADVVNYTRGVPDTIWIKDNVNKLRKMIREQKFPFIELKHPLFYACKEFSMTVWWEDENDNVCFFDYLPDNYPSFSMGSFDSRKEAKERAVEMENEGWEVLDNETDEL